MVPRLQGFRVPLRDPLRDRQSIRAMARGLSYRGLLSSKSALFKGFCTTDLCFGAYHA